MIVRDFNERLHQRMRHLDTVVTGFAGRTALHQAAIVVGRSKDGRQIVQITTASFGADRSVAETALPVPKAGLLACELRHADGRFAVELDGSQIVGASFKDMPIDGQPIELGRSALAS